MRYLLLLLVFATICGCREDDDAIPQPPNTDCADLNCPHEDEFFGKAVMNGECWQADWTYSDLSLSRISIFLGKAGTDNIGEILSFSIYRNSDWQDTILLGSYSSTDTTPNFASVIYGYEEEDASAGQFRFNIGDVPTGDDYLLIDYYNADTTIVEGRFQVHFPVRSVNSYVTAPDSMRLECGSFRVEVE